MYHGLGLDLKCRRMFVNVVRVQQDFDELTENTRRKSILQAFFPWPSQLLFLDFSCIFVSFQLKLGFLFK